MLGRDAEALETLLHILVGLHRPGVPSVGVGGFLHDLDLRWDTAGPEGIAAPGVSPLGRDRSHVGRDSREEALGTAESRVGADARLDGDRSVVEGALVAQAARGHRGRDDAESAPACDGRGAGGMARSSWHGAAPRASLVRPILGDDPPLSFLVGGAAACPQGMVAASPAAARPSDGRDGI